MCGLTPCTGSKIKSSPHVTRQSSPVSRGSATRVVSSSRYGTPKVKMSFGRRKS